MEISVECLREYVEARYLSVIFSPTKYDEEEEYYTDYNWFEVYLPFEKVE